MRTKKKILLLVVFIFAAAVTGYYYVFYGGARDVASEESVYTLTTADLTKEFSADAQKANVKYSNKTLNISGIATACDPTEIKIDAVVSCSFTTTAPQVSANQKITIKGRFVGYDELFGEFKFDQCTLTNNP